MIRFFIKNGNNSTRFDMPTDELFDHLGSIGIRKDIPIGGSGDDSVKYYPASLLSTRDKGENMQILLFLFGVLLGTGLFMLLANALKIPYLKTSKAVMNTGRNDKKLSKSIEAILLGIAAKLGRIIPMDKYKKTRLESTLKSAGIKMTPETFTALSFVKAFSVALLAVPCAFFMPLLIPFFIILAVAIYFRENGKADEKMREKRDAIEQELPRFVATVEQELKTSKEFTALYREIHALLPEEKRKNLELMIDAHTAMRDEVAINAFINGFKLGVNLAAESLYSEEK